MEELYKELLLREKHLESLEQTTITKGRIAELQLVIIRVQQIILSKV